MTSPQEGEQAVRRQLEQVLSSPAFSAAPRLSSLLRYLVEETLAGRGNQLKEYTLGTAVLGRGRGFDPRLDSIVRVEASKLRARLCAYYKDAGANDPILIELLRGSYAPRIVAQSRENRAPRQPGTIAILPFANLGPEPDTEYLCDGLAEEIIDRLGTMPGLRVVARTSAFQFRDKAGNIQEIGRALNAEYLIEGSIRKSGNRLRITARLIEAGSGYQAWSHAYDDTAEDIFSVQTKIANAVGGALSEQYGLSVEGPAPARLHPEAYHLYLRGRFHRNQWTLGGLEKSIDSFQRALALEPQSALILGALSEVQTMRPILGDIPAAPNMRRARETAELAIALDEHCAHAHLSLGWIHNIYDWDWESGQAAFERAIGANPSFAEAAHVRGIFLALRQRVAEAEESFRKAIELDPLSLVIQTHAAMVPYFSGKLDEAEARAESARAMEPNFAETYWVLGWIYERQERHREALEAFETAARFGGESPTILGDIAFLHARLGHSDRAREFVARLETGFPRPHPAASSLARIHLGLGDRAASSAWMEQAFEARDVMLPWACADRRYEEMWTLPGLSELRVRILGAAAR